jgi:hypothetical protein
MNTVLVASTVIRRRVMMDDNVEDLDRKLVMVERARVAVGQSAAREMWVALGLPGQMATKRVKPRETQSVERLCERIVVALRDGPPSGMSLVDLRVKTQPSTSAERGAALDALVERGTLVWERVKTKTRTKIVFRVAV